MSSQNQPDPRRAVRYPLNEVDVSHLFEIGDEDSESPDSEGDGIDNFGTLPIGLHCFDSYLYSRQRRGLASPFGWGHLTVD
jgi:hypothetical protein